LKRLAWSILMVFPFGVLAAEIYRSVGEDGLVIYSDMPSESAERIVINTLAPSPAVVTSSQPDDSNVGGAASDPPVVAEVPREATQEEVAAERAQNCQTSRERVEAYSTARRLFRSLPDGDREYLSDAEIDEARAQAQSDVASWCD